jgi:DNA-binding NtrC family response regulator
MIAKRHVLMIDDDPEVLKSQEIILQSVGIKNVISLHDSRKVLPVLKEREIQLILLDLTLPYIQGKELLETIKEEHPEIPVIVITGTGDVDTAVSCIKEGAYDYMVKPVEKNRFLSSIQHALEINTWKHQFEQLKERFLYDSLEQPECFSSIITNNNRMRSIFKYIETIGKTDQPILITGETGTGKELFARAIHAVSRRRGEFVPVNIAGLDDNFFSDALFGHKKGAFTGAETNRKGLIQSGAEGTVFLDEIGDLPSSAQVKLLRIIESGEYYQLGSDVLRKSNARLIMATNKPLKELLSEKKFRKDLYYRISSHQVEIPPLRERKDDISLLLNHFLTFAAHALDIPEPRIPRTLLSLLLNYRFPGNVRELRSLIFDAVSKQVNGVLPLQPFKEAINISSRIESGDDTKTISFGSSFPTLEKATEYLIDEALHLSDGNISAAAKILGISHQALSKRLQRKRQKRKLL